MALGLGGEVPQNGGGWAWCEEAQGVGGRARWEKVIASALGIGVVRRSEASGVGRVANWPEATAGGIRARRIMAKAVVLGARRPKVVFWGRVWGEWAQGASGWAWGVEAGGAGGCAVVGEALGLRCCVGNCGKGGYRLSVLAVLIRRWLGP